MEAKARRMVMDPTRPKIISKVNTISERELSSGVIPKERPTVAIAEAVSNKVVRMGRDSTELMSRAEKMVSPRYSINTQEAVLRVSSSTGGPAYQHQTDNKEQAGFPKGWKIHSVKASGSWADGLKSRIQKLFTGGFALKYFSALLQ